MNKVKCLITFLLALVSYLVYQHIHQGVETLAMLQVRLTSADKLSNLLENVYPFNTRREEMR